MKNRKRNTHVKIGTIDFNPVYRATTITIVDAKSDFVAGKPTRSIFIDVKSKWDALSLFDVARKAVEYHREQERLSWKTCDDALKVTS
jgi:hypothetical protein